MKRYLIIAIALVLALYANAQNAVYTHQNARIIYPDKIHLIANISSNHHLLVIRYRKKPQLSIYNHLLSLKVRKELPITISDDSEVEVFPFLNYYYVTTYIQKTRKHGLWKIDAAGNCTDMLASLRNLIRTQFADTNTTIRIIPCKNRLYIMTHVYYPDIGSTTTTQIQTDSLLQPVEIRRVTYGFKDERLHQVLPMGENHLLVLATGIDEEGGNFLRIRKINTRNGYTVATHFNSKAHLFLKPALWLNAKDSSIFLYSFITGNSSGLRRHNQVFIARLSDSLKQLSPTALQRSTTSNHFILIDAAYQQWLCLSGLGQANNRVYVNRGVGDRLSYNEYNRSAGNENPDLSFRQPIPYSNYYQYYSPPQIRLSMLNDQLQLIQDSVLLNDKRKYTILPDEFAKFSFENKGFLLLKHQFPSKGRGLLLLYSSTKNGLQTIDMPVYERYDYKLQQLQQAPDGSVLIPFMYKQEAGIMKLKTGPDFFSFLNEP